MDQPLKERFPGGFVRNPKFEVLASFSNEYNWRPASENPGGQSSTVNVN